MPKDLICPLEMICEYYNRYLVLYEKGKVEDYEDISKVIRLYSDKNYFCGALRAIHREDKQENIGGKDCALIQLLNNTEGLRRFPNETSL